MEWGNHVECAQLWEEEVGTRNSTSSIPESNLFLFPQTYIFTDEEDDALKRRMGNDTTFPLHLQPLSCPDLERGSGSPEPALPTETHPCHVLWEGPELWW